MTSDNLWGDLPEVEDLRTPASILKEQATRLTEMTAGALRGKTTYLQLAGGKFNLELRIVAQPLQGYEYTVAKITHPIEQYPLTITADLGGERVWRASCTDEAEFVAALREVLTADKTRAVIASLLAQIKVLGKAASG